MIHHSSHRSHPVLVVRNINGLGDGEGTYHLTSKFRYTTAKLTLLDSLQNTNI